MNGVAGKCRSTVIETEKRLGEAAAARTPLVCCCYMVHSGPKENMRSLPHADSQMIELKEGECHE